MHTFGRTLSPLLALISFQTVLATFDMNLHEMQYVADHLTYHECRQLSEALQMDGFSLDHPVTGDHEKNVSCLTLLLAWDRSDKGRGRSFINLSIRLEEIGRYDLASRLAQKVYGEKALEARESFVKNPFKKMVQKAPLLLDPPASGNDDRLKKPPGLEWSCYQKFSVVCGVLSFIALIVYGVGSYTNWKSCRKYSQMFRDTQLDKRRKVTDLYQRVASDQTEEDMWKALQEECKNDPEKIRALERLAFQGRLQKEEERKKFEPKVPRSQSPAFTVVAEAPGDQNRSPEAAEGQKVEALV